MRKLVLLCASLCAMAFIASAVPAHATSPMQTWVSSSGMDTGSCPQSAPCASFAYATTQTAAGGVISCLTGGDFGAVTIIQSVTIDCGTGEQGRITTTGTFAISINASSAATVILRHLSLTGSGSGNNTQGIFINSFATGSQLYVQDVSIQEFGTGIFFSVNVARALMDVSDTTVANNGFGITVNAANSGNIVSAVLDRVKISGSSFVGLELEGSGTIAGALRHSVVAESGTNGLHVAATGGVFFTVEESSLFDNLSSGLATIAAGVNLEVGGSTIGGNGTGLSSGAGSIYTFGNNQVSANGSNGSFTPGGPGLQ